ncbi:hypothetical protein CLV62_10362 [Dysgonomonas alginatilytica]|uniref:Uncharacterized protein n=1 Tax=Dysgonomonas alginatilytica TaxID=1605892 RepID=A0A2V3PRR7_9BACT|nr:hypothetical protein [Dysgonomonas alginatilytica]PXV67389.1 hypothetical protein CLV62_10362 [Dysgonomonas alginatilytica]
MSSKFGYIKNWIEYIIQQRTNMFNFVVYEVEHINIKDSLRELFTTLEMAHIIVDDLFINVDSEFNSKEFKRIRLGKSVVANIDFNKRNGEFNYEELPDKYCFTMKNIALKEQIYR